MKLRAENPTDDDWWDTQRPQRLFDWKLSMDELWYIGESDNATIRLSTLAGFKMGCDPAIELLTPNNVSINKTGLNFFITILRRVCCRVKTRQLPGL